MTSVVDIVQVPSRTIAVMTFHVAHAELSDMGPRMGHAFGTVAAALERAGSAARGPAVACYRPTGDGFDVCAGFDVAGAEPGDDIEILVLPAGPMAHTTHWGSYEQLPAAYEALRAGAAGQGWALADEATMLEEYWTGPDAPPEQTRTEIYWPVTGG